MTGGLLDPTPKIRLYPHDLTYPVWPGAERLLQSSKGWVAAVRALGPRVLNLDNRLYEWISKTALSKRTVRGSRPFQYSSCSRTQLMVPALSLRPLGTRSSQLSAPISSSAPR